MYTVKEIDGMFYVVKGEKVVSIGYHFEPEAWEKVRDFDLMVRYRRSGVPTQAVSEEHEEKLERDFLDLFMRLVVYGFGLFGFIVALYESIAWITS
jgi:hypothetical protein